MIGLLDYNFDLVPITILVPYHTVITCSTVAPRTVIIFFYTYPERNRFSFHRRCKLSRRKLLKIRAPGFSKGCDRTYRFEFAYRVMDEFVGFSSCLPAEYRAGGKVFPFFFLPNLCGSSCHSEIILNPKKLGDQSINHRGQ